MDRNNGHLPWQRKLAYGAGDFGFSITSTVIGVYFLIFLTDVVGIRPALAGLVVLISKQWDWINDPLIGHLSDRTRTRWGRRRPFLLFGFIPFGVLFALLWWKVPLAQQGLLALYYIGVMMIYDTAATFAYMPYFALTPELTQDYDERTSLTAYRMAFSILGSIVAFTVPAMIVGTWSPENADRILGNGILFAVMGALPLLITFFGTREHAEDATESQPNLREALDAAIHNKPFLFSAGIFLFTWCAVDVLSAVLLYYLRYYLHRQGLSDVFFTAIFVTALLFLPFWTMVSRKSNKRLAYIWGVAFWAVVQLVLIILPPDVSTTVVIALGCCAGIGVSAAHVLPWSIIPDAVEWDELQTGHRHEGMFYSLILLAQKAAAGLALGAVGLILDLSGYLANAETQIPSALRAIKFVTGAGPAILLIAGIIFAALYPISRAEHQRIREELARREKGGSERF